MKVHIPLTGDSENSLPQDDLVVKRAGFGGEIILRIEGGDRHVAVRASDLLTAIYAVMPETRHD